MGLAIVGAIDVSPLLSETEAASRLGMSRALLRDLVDRGEVVSHHIGLGVRRIRLRDLAELKAQRQRDRLDLAAHFACQPQTATAATDEIADLI